MQAEGAAPFHAYVQRGGEGEFHAVTNPETLATAIRIGDPVSWPKALHEVRTTNGTVEKVTEQEIADALERRGIEVEKHQVLLDEPLKQLGTYKVQVKVAAHLIAEVTVTVEPKG